MSKQKTIRTVVKIVVIAVALVLSFIAFHTIYYNMTTPTIKKSFSKFCGTMSIEECEEIEYQTLGELREELSAADFFTYLVGDMSDNFFRDYREETNDVFPQGTFRGVAFAKDKNTIKNIRWDLSIYETAEGKFKVITIFENSDVIEKR